MNEQISRILKLLEDGKITADAAERLIRALQEVGGNGSSERRWQTGYRSEPPDILRVLMRAIRAAGRRQRRLSWWRYYRFQDQLARCRRKRAEEMSTADRVAHIFTHRGLADPDELQANATLEDLGFDQVARAVLRWALQDEFGVEMSEDTLASLWTYGAVVEWAERHSAGHSTAATEAANPEPAAAPEPPSDPEPAAAPEPPSDPEGPPEPSQAA